VKPEGDKPKPKPKPAEPEREKPPLSSSGGTGGKSPSKQVIAFLPIAAVTPSPVVIAPPTVAEKASPTPVAAQVVNSASSPINNPASVRNVTIPIIVKDTTSVFWQIVLAGARKAGKDYGVNVPEFGPQSESDINGEISILEDQIATLCRHASSQFGLGSCLSRTKSLHLNARPIEGVKWSTIQVQKSTIYLQFGLHLNRRLRGREAHFWSTS
jgi:hypothetical protein